ncbi:transcription factor bHLH30-like isoform X2 [Humulus lupulus]|nr:transcription factor bHLH30-like isoform X2 [Humulus lupulus]
MHHHHQQDHQISSDHHIYNGGGRSALLFPEVSPILQPTAWSLPPVHAFNPSHFGSNPVRDHDPFLAPPPPSSSYANFMNRRGGGAPSLQFTYDGSHHHPSSDHLRILSDTIGPVVQPGSAPFGLQAELGKMTAQEIMDAKALAASKSHSEAERRRRERINNHLAKLRSLLPSTTKTDKASLLAEVIQHVKELKRQTSLIAETSPVPTETDELTVDDASSDEDGRFIIKASLCCEDRSDLLPDLIKTLKALRLRTLKAEITTLGGRVKNVLFITGDEDSGAGADDEDDDDEDQDQPTHQYCISSIQEALKAVIEKKASEDSSSGSVKRQRTTNNINIYP